MNRTSILGFLGFEGEIVRIEYDKDNMITAIVADDRIGRRIKIEIGKPELPMDSIPETHPTWISPPRSQRPPLKIIYS